MCFDVTTSSAAIQFAAQQFGKNLQMTRAIDESRAGFSNGRQSNRHGISIADRSALKTRSAFDPIGLVEQLTNGDLRFARVVLPFRDRVGDGIVELE